MGVLIAAVAGLIFWIVAWSLGAKSFDAFMLTALIFLIACAGRIIRQQRERARARTADA